MPITNHEEAQVTPKQHEKPCHDCPWRRKSIPGWLGEMSADEWAHVAHGDANVKCHALKKDDGEGDESHHQCAGINIFRANVCKAPRDRVIRLTPDRGRVFSNSSEFRDHHKGRRGEE